MKTLARDFDVKSFAQREMYSNKSKYDPRRYHADVLIVKVAVLNDYDAEIELWEVLFEKGVDLMENPIWNWKKTTMVKSNKMALIA